MGVCIIMCVYVCVCVKHMYMSPDPIVWPQLFRVFFFTETYMYIVHVHCICTCMYMSMYSMIFIKLQIQQVYTDCVH